MQPNISADDLFIQNDPSEQIGRLDDDSFNAINTLDETGNAKIAHRHENDETVDKSGNAKIAHRANIPETLDNSGNAEIAQDYYINKTLDTNRHNKDSDKADLQDQILLENLDKIVLSRDATVKTFIPERVFMLIKTFSETFEEAEKTVKTIHNAKKSAEKETGINIYFESLKNYGYDPETGLYDTLLRAYQKKRTEEVGNIHNLIFIYVKNWFVERPISFVRENNINTY